LHEELCRDDLAKVIQQSLDQLLSFLRSREFSLFDTGNWGAFLGGARGTKRSKLGGTNDGIALEPMIGGNKKQADLLRGQPVEEG